MFTAVPPDNSKNLLHPQKHAQFISLFCPLTFLLCAYDITQMVRFLKVACFQICITYFYKTLNKKNGNLLTSLILHDTEKTLPFINIKNMGNNHFGPEMSTNRPEMQENIQGSSKGLIAGQVFWTKS